MNEDLTCPIQGQNRDFNLTTVNWQAVISFAVSDWMAASSCIDRTDTEETELKMSQTSTRPTAQGNVPL